MVRRTESQGTGERLYIWFGEMNAKKSSLLPPVPGLFAQLRLCKQRIFSGRNKKIGKNTEIQEHKIFNIFGFIFGFGVISVHSYSDKGRRK
jgi:hypothetical protein